MALGYLMILTVALIVVGVILQVLLYTGKYKHNPLIFILNAVFAVLVVYLDFTSLPTNYLLQKALAAMFGVIAILSLFIRFKTSSSEIIGKIMVSISLIGSLAQLFL